MNRNCARISKTPQIICPRFQQQTEIPSRTKLARQAIDKKNLTLNKVTKKIDTNIVIFKLSIDGICKEGMCNQWKVVTHLYIHFSLLSKNARA